MVKDKIKDQINLKEYISQYIELNESNKGICPFHEGDTDPSLSIKDDFWHCFGCGKGGDIFNFVMLYHKVGFSEALSILKKYLGITDESNYTTYYEDMQVLYNQFIQNFPAIYLREREIPYEVAKTFEIGYVDGYSGPIKILEKYKLIKNNRLLINNSISFPYRDSRGVIGFSFKPINGYVKYLNIPNNEVFRKSDHFFGWSQALPYIKESKQVFLVEGFFDAIRMYSIGYKNTLAILGSDLSEAQLNKLNNLKVREIILAFDGDHVGDKAALISFFKILNKGITPWILAFPGGLDPDEYFKNNSKLFYLTHDVIKFFKEYFSKDQLDLLLKSLSFLEDINLYTQYFDQIKSNWPEIPEKLLASRVNKKIRDVRFTKQTQIYLEIIRSLIFGRLSFEDIEGVDFKNFSQDVAEIRDIYQEYGYFETSKINEKYLVYPSIESDDLRRIIMTMKFLDNEMSLEELIKYKEQLYAGNLGSN